jgi:hypothetical protein
MEATRANGQPAILFVDPKTQMSSMVDFKYLIRRAHFGGGELYQDQGNDREGHASESAPYLIAPAASFLRLCRHPRPRRSCVQCVPDAPSAGGAVMRRSAAGLRSRAAGSRSKIGARGKDESMRETKNVSDLAVVALVDAVVACSRTVTSRRAQWPSGVLRGDS